MQKQSTPLRSFLFTVAVAASLAACTDAQPEPARALGPLGDYRGAGELPSCDRCTPVHTHDVVTGATTFQLLDPAGDELCVVVIQDDRAVRDTCGAFPAQ